VEKDVQITSHYGAGDALDGVCLMQAFKEIRASIL